MGIAKKIWTFEVGLVGLFEIDWKTPCNDWLVEFLNTW
jgi:hypothetical protein